jgi:hypothetical protein
MKYVRLLFLAQLVAMGGCDLDISCLSRDVCSGSSSDDDQPRRSDRTIQLRLNVVSGNTQTAPAGTTLPQELVVELVDGYAKPYYARDIVWTATSGTLAGGQTMTDSQGRARARWTLNILDSLQTVRVEARDDKGV